MKITYYHWGVQCPVINETLNILGEYKNKIDIEIIDFTNDHSICQSQQIYFPFLTVFNNKQRWFRPLDQRTIEDFLSGMKLIEKPHIRTWSNEVFTGKTQVLTLENIQLVNKGCTLTNCSKSCTEKGRFLNENGLDTFGIVHVSEDMVVGGAEYMPSLKVPYDIPKNEGTAFLTCLYHSSEMFDYKSLPLKELEIILSLKFNSLIAVTDEVGSFPNGDLKWFLDRGYSDLGIISVEENYCTLHLVRKEL